VGEGVKCDGVFVSLGRRRGGARGSPVRTMRFQFSTIGMLVKFLPNVLPHTQTVSCRGKSWRGGRG